MANPVFLLLRLFSLAQHEAQSGARLIFFQRFEALAYFSMLDGFCCFFMCKQ
jgi:hypothetical protein